MRPTLAAACVLALFGTARAQDDKPAAAPAKKCVLDATIATGFPVADQRVLDVDRDGRADLVLPRGDECELWLNGGVEKATGLPKFTKAATIRVELRRAVSVKAEALSDVLENSFRVPRLSIADVDGDGRPDLLVEN